MRAAAVAAVAAAEASLRQTDRCWEAWRRLVRQCWAALHPAVLEAAAVSAAAGGVRALCDGRAKVRQRGSGLRTSASDATVRHVSAARGSSDRGRWLTWLALGLGLGLGFGSVLHIWWRGGGWVVRGGCGAVRVRFGAVRCCDRDR